MWSLYFLRLKEPSTGYIQFGESILRDLMSELENQVSVKAYTLIKDNRFLYLDKRQEIFLSKKRVSKVRQGIGFIDLRPKSIETDHKKGTTSHYTSVSPRWPLRPDSFERSGPTFRRRWRVWGWLVPTEFFFFYGDFSEESQSKVDKDGLKSPSWVIQTEIKKVSHTTFDLYPLQHRTPVLSRK